MAVEGWKTGKLGELCDIKIGGTPSRAVPEYWEQDLDGGNPWVSISDLLNNPVIKTKEKITDQGVKRSNVKLIPAGTNLMSFKLTMGRVARAGVDLYTNEAIAAFLPKSKDIDHSYLYYILPQAAEGADHDQAVKGKTLNKEKLNALKVLVPPLSEQKKIADILESVDDVITKTEAVIAQTERVKQGLLQQLLTRGIGHTKFKQTDLGEIPESWDVVNIGSLSSVIRGASPRPQGDPRYYGGTVPRLMVSDVTRDGKYVTPKTDFLTEEGALKSRPVPAGTLVMVCSGTVGVPSFLAIDACIHDGFLAFLDISNVCEKEFLFYNFSLFQRKLDQSATHGGVFTNLTTSIIKEYQIALPPITEQRKICQVLSETDMFLNTEREYLSGLIKVKQGLMSDLLTGRVRVNVDATPTTQSEVAA